jgi:hypothetical protein
MPASYPTSVKTYTTKNNGDSIQAAHVNELQDEVTAIETDLIKTWSAWSPTWTNVTVGDGTVVARYFKLGRMVWFELHFTLGSTSAVSGLASVDLPVDAAGVAAFNVGHGEVIDASGFQYGAYTRLTAVDRMAIFVDNGTSAVQLAPLVPFTWTQTDGISLIGFYEAAS